MFHSHEGDISIESVFLGWRNVPSISQYHILQQIWYISGVVYSETLPRAGEVFPTCRNIRWNKLELEIILYLLRG